MSRIKRDHPRVFRWLGDSSFDDTSRICVGHSANAVVTNETRNTCEGKRHQDRDDKTQHCLESAVYDGDWTKNCGSSNGAERRHKSIFRGHNRHESSFQLKLYSLTNWFIKNNFPQPKTRYKTVFSLCYLIKLFNVAFLSFCRIQKLFWMTCKWGSWNANVVRQRGVWVRHGKRQPVNSSMSVPSTSD